jgi:hypothetical protein
MSDLRDIATLCKEIDILTAEVKQLREERNEARRMYCRGFTDFCPNPKHAAMGLEEAAAEVAKSFEWDCFKEAK